ncbi:glycerol-1-phosphate phosphohydrolase [Trichophyton mentagrophytes]|uniref:Glycerol-3-phosphate phosphatase n=2 Tax=Trichophyton TaxID=5550 RepID=A0A059JBW2_TRIIM|nr:hypothetical protein H101_06220 [Trichophyton interdigitale H6]KDB25340.1 hypothetical protein H109_02805 [Trichophyton interdigitale MR816]GBF67001.1 glycerol-1-phosphate phosphohydrolase [Trichophyton mentagrophytes]DAA73084.1 TPA_exp: Uncharacterized protein A8136_5009 [Trichophyton benhamiae CBS 112371]
MGSTGSFSGPRISLTFDGLLFDFDGTIVDSTAAVVKHWHIIGEEIGVDPKVILQTSHGRRSIDMLKILAPEKATWEYVSMIEGRIPKDLGNDATEIPGARRILTSLEEAGAPWAVVTSGSNALITGWLGVLQLAHPKYLVVAEDVQVGKPDPSCYLLGRSRLGLEHSDSMLVIEDAPSGVRAGKAAGFKVLALATTHVVEELKEAGADWIIKDLDSASLKKFADGKVEIEVWDTLQ